MNDTNPIDPNTNPYVAFCQNCGTSLTAETVRRVGPAVYCEPCLEARLHGAVPPAGSVPPPSSGYGPVFSGGGPAGPGGPYVAAQNPFGSGVPNPGLAALLGLIPGVGAMYNEQYAKGIVHLLIFAFLVSFEHVSGVFGLFVFGWIAYMSIEAHHTARARRDGTPLPNPFGLNDIGERMGFAKAWPNGPDIATAARDAARDAFHTANAGFNRPPSSTVPPAQPGAAATSTGWGAPTDAYPPNPNPPYGGYGSTFVPPTQSYSQPYTPPYTQTAYAETFIPPVPPGVPIPVPMPPRNRFPAGALWLITLGMIFLLGTLGLFNTVPVMAFLGVTVIVLGVWLFLHRMMETGEGLHYDGSPEFHLRVLRALKGSIWLIAIGILELLDSFHLVHWHDSWPWLIILVGVMMLLQRAAYNHAAYTQYPAAVPPAAASTTSTTSITKTEGGN